MANKESLPCPFTYADGRQCNGEIVSARAYGRQTNGFVQRDDVRKYRLWCSLKWDHAGAISGFVEKVRMEFYPDRLPDGMEDALWDRDMLE